MSRNVAERTFTWSVPDSDHPDHEELQALSIELATRLRMVARLPRYAALWPECL